MLYSKAQLLEMLRALDAKLSSVDVVGELYVVGGAALVLGHESRHTTKDIDAYYQPAGVIRELAAEVADEFGVDVGWLNDGAKGFIGPNASFMPLISLNSLDVYVIADECLLAMKLTSARADSEDTDIKDALFLARKCDVTTVEQLYDIAEKYAYAFALTPKASLFIQLIADMLEEEDDHAQAKA